MGLGFRIPIINGIPDCLSFIMNFEAQDSIVLAKISWIAEFGFLYHGAVARQKNRPTAKSSLWTADVSPRSSPLTEVSRGGTSATQRQKFHTDDVNQHFHNKTGSHGVPNANLFNFTFLLVDFGKVLCSSANELQQNSNASSREDYIPQILTVLLEILRIYIWPLRPFVFFLSFVNNR